MYAEPSDLVRRYDQRVLGELASDTGTRVNPSDLASSPILTTALEDASGEIEASLLQGKRYSAAQLAALTGNSLAHLKRICCEIAFGLLWERRSYRDSDERDAAMERGRKTLDRLRRGEVAFDIEEVKAAGLPGSETPSRVSTERLGLIVDQARGHFYPWRRYPCE